MNTDNRICYLCGEELIEDLSVDHVPPKNFYATELRKKHNLNLRTISTHRTCNQSYKDDEEYLVQSMAPLAIGSVSANAVWKDIQRSFKRPEGIRLGQMILGEYEVRPSGLILPNNRVLKRINSSRVGRVIWKITRGLFFEEYGRYLPENKPRKIDLVSVDEKPPGEYAYVADAESKGRYPEIFDYKHKEYDDEQLHIWAYLLWDKIISLVYFHSPECDCDLCEE